MNMYLLNNSIKLILLNKFLIAILQTENPFRRSLEYAIGLGGDTDTIACMTGALAGAFYGDSIIAENLLKHCEGHEDMEVTAQKLFEASERK